MPTPAANVTFSVEVPAAPLELEKKPLPELLSASVVVPLLVATLPHWSSSCSVNAVLVTESTVGDDVFGVTATCVGAPP